MLAWELLQEDLGICEVDILQAAPGSHQPMLQMDVMAVRYRCLGLHRSPTNWACLGADNLVCMSNKKGSSYCCQVVRPVQIQQQCYCNVKARHNALQDLCENVA